MARVSRTVRPGGSGPEAGQAAARAATLRDVAARAGVNAATASVVLNKTLSGTRVSEATRGRILAAAADLGYRPNAAARGMKRRRMDTLGVVATIDGGELNLYFLELLNGILEAATARGHNATVFSVADWRADERKLLAFCDGRVDGMVLIGPRLREGFAPALRARIPFVAIENDGPVPGAWNLRVDGEEGAYLAVRHLTERGHRRILHLTGPLDSPTVRERLDGYCRALAGAGVPYDPSLVVPCRFSSAAGRRRMAEWLREAPVGGGPPTAIFCATDALASGCMEALEAAGLRVPEDVSVAGFDDTLAARMTSPPLTTVRQPFREMGRAAVDLLLEELDRAAGGAAPAPPGERCFDVELVVRGSAGPPAAGISLTRGDAS